MATETVPWIRAATVLGVPSVIALFLVWWLTSHLVGDVEQLRQLMIQHDQRRAHDIRLLLAAAYAACLNAATDDLGRSRCVVLLERREDRAEQNPR